MPLNNDFKYELGVSYLKRSAHEKAEKLFSEIVESDVHYIEAWMNYSNSVSLSKGYEKAIEVIEKALDKNKDEASLWYRLAAYLYKSGKVQQSYYYIETALKIDFEKHHELIEFMPELNLESRFIELLGIYKGTE
jgi:Tfp pilus assembly protein PilF